MHKRNKLKVSIAIAVAMVFVMPVAAFANIDTIGVTSNIENTVNMETMVESTNSDDSDNTENTVSFIHDGSDNLDDINTLSTIYVDDDNTEGPWDGTWEHPYQYIQDGIDNATDGGTVYVFNGTYYELVTVNKQLDLVGESRENTIVDGSSATGVLRFVIFIIVSEVYVSTFTVRNGDYGIFLHEPRSNDSIIENCNSHNHSGIGIYVGAGICGFADNISIINCASYNNSNIGIQVSGGLSGSAENVSIINCDVHDNKHYGIQFSEALNGEITGCNVYDNGCYGIVLFKSPICKLEDNTIYDNLYNFNVQSGGTSGGPHDFYHDIGPSNTVNDKPIWYLIGTNDFELNETHNFGYLGLISCTNIIAKNSDVCGMLVVNTTNSTISNVSSHDGGVSLYLFESSYNNITNCNLYNNQEFNLMYGLKLERSSHNNIINCTMYNNNNEGILLVTSSYNNIENCTSYGNGKPGFSGGITLAGGSSYNTVTNCDFYDNFEYGIQIASSSTYNIFTDCNVYTTDGYGICICFSSATNYNTIVNCKSYNNSYHGFFIVSAGYNNIIDCSAYNNSQTGIYFLRSTTKNTVTNCDVYGNKEFGVYFLDSSNCKLRNNIIHDNVYGFGVASNKAIMSNFIHDIDTSNTIDGKPIYYLVGETDRTLNETDDFSYLALVSCSNIIVENSDAYGILLVETAGSTISNVNSYNSEVGIYILHSPDNDIVDCAFYNNRYGVYLQDSGSPNFVFKGNSIYDNAYNFGIEGTSLSDFYYDIDTSNTIEDKPMQYLVKENNKVLDGNFGYLGLISCTNITAKNSDVNGVMLLDTTKSTISNVNSHDSRKGIYLRDSPFNNITNCDSYNNSGVFPFPAPSVYPDGHGVYLEYSPYCNIVGCNAYDNSVYGICAIQSSNSDIIDFGAYNNRYGIEIQASMYITITNSISHDNFIDGIRISMSSRCTVTNCEFYNNPGHGINNKYSSHNDIMNCDIYNNFRSGIYLYGDVYGAANSNNIINCNSYDNEENGIHVEPRRGSADNNNIVSCNFYGNGESGVYINPEYIGYADNNNIVSCNFYGNGESGVYINPGDMSSANNNMICYNNFVNNIAGNAHDPNSNFWDDDSGKGNYWDDYDGVDVDPKDGIGDTPYNITGGTNQDRFPLMSPRDETPPAITNVHAIPPAQKPGGPVNITCTVTDNWGLVDTVKVNISGPEGFTLEAVMNEGYWYEYIYTTIGVYHYHIWADDTSGNNATSDVYYFVISEDTTPPEISDVTLTTSDPLDTDPLYGWEKVTCIVTDNLAVDEVKLVVTNPDTTQVEYDMPETVTDTYECTITLTQPGNYSYHIWADDLSGNPATTEPDELFSLPANWDVDLNGQAYFEDLVEIVWIYGDTGPGYPLPSSFGWVREDVDNTGQAYFEDLVEIVWHYGEWWWT